MPKRWAGIVLARTPASRVTVAAVSLLGTVAIYFADVATKETSLAPLVTLPVLTLTYACGWAIGLIFSIVAGLTFGSIDHSLWSVLPNALVLTASFAMVVILFSVARSLYARALVMESELGGAKLVHDQFFVNVNDYGPSHWRPQIAHAPLRDMGGDFYSFETSDDGNGAEIFLADVSGKGVQASMLHSALKTLLRADKSDDPGTKLTFLNQNLRSVCGDEMFCTAWYGRLRNDGLVTFANAGHELPFVQRLDGTIQIVNGGQIALGIEGSAVYASSTVRLSPGEKLLVCTDGLTDLLDRGILDVSEFFADFERARHRIAASTARRDDVLAIRIDYVTAALPLRGSQVLV